MFFLLLIDTATLAQTPNACITALTDPPGAVAPVPL